MALIAKLTQACSTALDQWPGELTAEEGRKIVLAMRQAELAAFPGESPMEDAISYTSLGLGLLDDLSEKIKDPARKRLVEDVERKMFALHKAMDRRLDHWRNYERATHAVHVWQEMMGG
jgi:hypothetical protein